MADLRKGKIKKGRERKGEENEREEKGVHGAESLRRTYSWDCTQWSLLATLGGLSTMLRKLAICNANALTPVLTL